jgi:hypothetical protein
MRYILAVILAAGSPAYAREAKTYQQLLGRDRVVKVMNEVISEAEERFRNSFLLDDTLVSQLSASGVGAQTLTLLTELKGREIQGRGKFIEALEMAVGKDQAKELRSERLDILEAARGELKVTGAFFQPVELLILRKPAPAGLNKRAAEDALEEGFSRFLDKFIAERRSAEQNTNKLVIGNQGLTDFIKRLEADCGKVPCELVCCDKCMPCP